MPIALVLLIAAVIARPADPPGPIPTNFPTPPNPAPSALERLVSPSRSVLLARARHIYRLPDGSVWDGHMLDRYRTALQRAVYRSESGNLAVRDESLAEAWGIQWLWSDQPGSMSKPVKSGRERVVRSSPLTTNAPLWRSLRPAEPQRSPGFIYINESDPDYLLSLDGWQGRYTSVTEPWPDGWFTIKQRHFASAQTTGQLSVINVKTDSPRQCAGGRLLGEFFLWPDASLQFADPRAAAAANRRYRYIPAAELRVSVEQLAEELEAGKFALSEFTFRRPAKDRPARWEESTLPVRFKPTPSP